MLTTRLLSTHILKRAQVLAIHKPHWKIPSRSHQLSPDQSNVLFCTSVDVYFENMAVVISGSRVHQPTTIRAGEAAKINIAAVTVDQGVVRLLHSSGPNVNIATAIVNTTKRRYMTDKTGGAAVQIEIEADTGAVAIPSIGSDLLDAPAGN